MLSITEEALPKINLTLKVRGRRGDGYHDIESLIAFAANAGDVVRFTPGERALLSVSGPFAAAIAGDNLIDAVLTRLAGVEPRLLLGSIDLEKRLPVAAGIGGGSADAAAVLRAVRRANPELAGAVDWTAIAASLGADVPVCLGCTAAFVSGVGERVHPVSGLPPLAAVLANPLAAVPSDKTARVFERLDARPAPAPAPLAPAMRFANADALIAYMAGEGNDLLAAATAIVPEIAGVRAALADLLGCRFVGLSGAGPTSYAIFSTAEEAAAAERSLQRSRPGWWVAAAELA